MTTLTGTELSDYVRKLDVELWHGSPQRKPEWCVYLLVDDNRPLIEYGPKRPERTYVGISNNPWKRLKYHNGGHVKATRGGAWRIVSLMAGLTREQAAFIEQYLKNGHTIQRRTDFRLLFNVDSLHFSNHATYWLRLPNSLRKQRMPMPPVEGALEVWKEKIERYARTKETQFKLSPVRVQKTPKDNGRQGDLQLL